MILDVIIWSLKADIVVIINNIITSIIIDYINIHFAIVNTLLAAMIDKIIYLILISITINNIFLFKINDINNR